MPFPLLLTPPPRRVVSRSRVEEVAELVPAWFAARGGARGWVRAAAGEANSCHGSALTPQMSAVRLLTLCVPLCSPVSPRPLGETSGDEA